MPSPCPIGDVCVSGACKVGGLQPCVQPSDCAYGTCTNGLCPLVPQNGVCIGMPNQNECDQTGTSTSFPAGCGTPVGDKFPICWVDTS
jgi:hypothetical protein